MSEILLTSSCIYTKPNVWVPGRVSLHAYQRVLLHNQACALLLSTSSGELQSMGWVWSRDGGGLGGVREFKREGGAVGAAALLASRGRLFGSASPCLSAVVPSPRVTGMPREDAWRGLAGWATGVDGSGTPRGAPPHLAGGGSLRSSP